MRNILKSLVVLTIVLTSCKKNQELDHSTDPHFVNIGLQLEMTSNKKSETINSVGHNYITEGYKVGITGLLTGGDILIEDVDLNNWNYSVEVTGDIRITIWHPDFDGTIVSTDAYYGAEDQKLLTSNNSSVTAKVTLQQGYTIVEAIDGAENLIEAISINGLEAELDTYYYTAMDVDIIVNTSRGELTGNHETKLGKGYKYVIKPVGSNIELDELPLFGGTPGDGNLNPGNTVINLNNLVGDDFDARSVNENGHVSGSTKGKAVWYFAEINEDKPLAEYGFDFNIDFSEGYTVNIYLRNGTGFNAEKKTISVHNVTEFESAKADYGDWMVRSDYSEFAEGSLYQGNFILRLGFSDYTGTDLFTIKEYSIRTIEIAEPIIAEKDVYTGIGMEKASYEALANGNVKITSNGSRFNIVNSVDGNLPLTSYSLDFKITEEDSNEHFINIYLKDENGDVFNAIYQINNGGYVYIYETEEHFDSFEDLKNSKYGAYIVYRRMDDVKRGNFFYRSGGTGITNNETVIFEKFDITSN